MKEYCRVDFCQKLHKRLEIGRESLEHSENKISYFKIEYRDEENKDF